MVDEYNDSLMAQASKENKSFRREGRYTVLKVSDVADALDPDEKTELIRLEEKVSLHRVTSGKELLTCVVVESDWPEYEPTWDAIEKRVSGVLDKPEIHNVLVSCGFLPVEPNK